MAKTTTWHLFCDESGISGKPYYAFGALWIREDNLQRFETDIQKIREKYFCTDEIKWQGANSKKYTHFYNELVTFFFKSNYLFFNCIVVQLSMVNKEFHNGNYELAKQKHFNQLICNKITDSLFKNRNHRFILTVDDLPFSYKKADEAMHIIANNIIKQKTYVSNAILELKEINSKSCHGVQLCDLLLGSVLSAYQKDVTSERKKALSTLVAHHLGWESLSYDTLRTEKKFNIWYFYDPTQGPRIIKSRETRLKYPLL
ncbi:DUF3800 domain-containing protein [Glaesserella parasuis]|uniref:DUF3800 domain-containing protein n=1 Tax=Glaesserella parasuis TaxID=738 RepID=UPI0003ABF690|nr:DUF3800 domain-containing protein [Glaesserella parasuis]EQA03745.1 hypothetical protein HPSSW114_0383 [Glaesserella parasuis SW114]MDD2170684.1 DUF3800 domain-containing protein [Glaesserella parasuis]MDD2171702.1 DUF3800 domain-containing protein [Glaesserella parasuis]MDO9830567.1 DUF3800 domain-containing protein [Glaesserella parasuis]MDP0119049.1 DUF3800 domain-containing protein [Glaesserella parasuis]